MGVDKEGRTVEMERGNAASKGDVYLPRALLNVGISAPFMILAVLCLNSTDCDHVLDADGGPDIPPSHRDGRWPEAAGGCRPINTQHSLQHPDSRQPVTSALHHTTALE